jgi:hypothetical protein
MQSETMYRLFHLLALCIIISLISLGILVVRNIEKNQTHLLTNFEIYGDNSQEQKNWQDIQNTEESNQETAGEEKIPQ